MRGILRTIRITPQDWYQPQICLRVLLSAQYYDAFVNIMSIIFIECHVAPSFAYKTLIPISDNIVNPGTMRPVKVISVGRDTSRCVHASILL